MEEEGEKGEEIERAGGRGEGRKKEILANCISRSQTQKIVEPEFACPYIILSSWKSRPLSRWNQVEQRNVVP